MIIKSINEISNVGNFIDFQNNVGSINDLKKYTFLYGLNTSGKTTLTSIFLSLKENKSEYITNRKTIPDNNKGQKIQLCFEKDKEEKCIYFDNGVWSDNRFSSNIEIFGTEFMHKNLFQGLDVTRENQENFTYFVLGENGVKQALEIKDDKAELSKLKKDLKDKLPKFLDNLSENEKTQILNLDISNLDIKILEQNLIEQKNKLQQYSNPKQILSIKDLNCLSFDNIKNILDIFTRINQLLKLNYTNIHDETLSKFENHLEKAFKNHDIGKKLIGEIRNNTKEDYKDCPYCGQEIKSNFDLLKAYASFFTDEYEQYIRTAEKEVSDLRKKLGNFYINEYNLSQSILNEINKIYEILKDEKIKVFYNDLNNCLNEQIKDDFFNIFNLTKNNLLLKIDEKNKFLHKSIDIVNLNDFENIYNLYKSWIEKINNIISQINLTIKDYKQKYNGESLDNIMSSCNSQIKNINMKIERIKQDKECKDYKDIIKNIEILAEKIKQNEEKLETEQNDYLNTYYDKINELYIKFGSRDFQLCKTTNKRGHQPVYFLEIKFKNQSISNENLKHVFSESDKRALALSIFWAKILLKDEEEKQETIAILDDPVTSFDDNRITSTIHQIFSANVGQIIVTTHYPYLIRKYKESKINKADSSFFEIEKTNNGSFIKNMDIDYFITSEFEKTLFKIMDFIDGKTNDDISTDLRIFMENYIKIVFAKQIKETKDSGNKIETFNNIVQTIFNENKVKEIMRLHSLLNTYMHQLDKDNLEDVRNIASGVLDCLYALNSNDIKNESKK